MAVCGPELQLRVGTGAQVEPHVRPAVAQLEAGNNLRVAAVEAFRDAQNRRQRPDGAPELAWQLRVVLV